MRKFDVPAAHIIASIVKLQRAEKTRLEIELRTVFEILETKIFDYAGPLR
jgi:hypothetical protein